MPGGAEDKKHNWYVLVSLCLTQSALAKSLEPFFRLQNTGEEGASGTDRFRDSGGDDETATVSVSSSQVSFSTPFSTVILVRVALHL